MLLTALFLSLDAQPERWVHLGGGAGAPSEYLDKDSIVRADPFVTVWTRRDVRPDGVTLWHELKVDCATRRVSILGYVRDERGTVSHNDARPHRDFRPVRSGTGEERVFRMVCR